VEIGILGPLEVRLDGRAVDLAGSRLRALVTRLAAGAPSVVSLAELVDALWPAGPPADPVNALQSLVSRVRRAVGTPGAIQQMAGGYRLTVDRGAVDAVQFADLVAAGRRELHDGAPATARDLLTTGLGLWRGAPLADAGDADYAVPEVTRLQDLRVDAYADLFEAELRLGRGGEIIGDLEALVLAHPLRERLAGQLVRALAAAGRTADALAAYDRVRDRLAGDLGVDPGGELQEVRLAVLRGEIVPAAADRFGSQRRSNLRSSLTSFIGRDAEVARVSELLATGRLVTVLGPGGAGKTRFASEVTRQWISRRSDGVWLVELAPVSDETAIAQAMLGALGQLDTRSVDRRVERHARPSIEHLLDVLADSDCLLLVDNCEHLIGPVATLIGVLLAGCPRLAVVATSREPLGIDGEALCVLPPLGLPPDGVTAAAAVEYQSVQLLVERARAVSAGFVVDDDTVAAVTDIVRRLDGLPLAIELAAAKLRVMPVAEIATRLSDRFRLLTGGSRTAMPRHRTLRAVVEWSWDLLTPDERLLAERLAVFPAGATTESATAVCGDDRLARGEIADLLLSLVDKSLLTSVDGTPTRYRMLETIREYGADRLAERGEARAARTAHARHFAAVAAEVDPLLRTPDQLAALNILVTERDNILAALRFLVESDDPVDRAAALDLALSLSWFWTMIGANADAAEWLGRVVAATEGSGHPGRDWARAAQAITIMFTGGENSADPTVLRADLSALARGLRAAGPPQVSSLAILVPMLAYLGEDPETADAAMAEMLQSPDGWLRSAARISRSWFAENEGDIESMRADIDAALVDVELIGDRWGLSSVLSARGLLRAQDGDIDGAIADHERAWQLATELGSSDDVLLIRFRMAGLYARAGDIDRARRIIEGVQVEFSGHTQGVERGLIAEGLLLGIEMQGGNLELASAMAADLRVRLAAHLPGRVQSHAAAIVGATTAIVAVQAGDLAQATADLARAFPLAVLTGDMPVVGMVGVSVGWLAAAMGRCADAAEILGAAARLRGSADATDPSIAEVTSRLRAALGDEFDELFAAGRAVDKAAAIARIDPTGLGSRGATDPQAGAVGPSSAAPKRAATAAP
jgi:predicted ATPase/DNA-binding SARP family transcriptional activator